MSSKLIVMLTNNDQTVKNGIELFEECKHLPVEFWGFKDIGLPLNKMKQLAKNMKQAKKTTFLEVVHYTEKECFKAVKIALECKVDYLMGTIFYDSIYNLLKDKPIKYFPFCGKICNHPSILSGSINEIIKDAQSLEKKGIDGFDLLTYRYIGNAEKLATEFVKSISVPVVFAGSINSYERLDNVKRLNPWAFTIGSAFFAKKFLKNGSFISQIEKVLEYI